MNRMRLSHIANAAPKPAIVQMKYPPQRFRFVLIWRGFTACLRRSIPIHELWTLPSPAVVGLLWIIAGPLSCALLDTFEFLSNLTVYHLLPIAMKEVGHEIAVSVSPPVEPCSRRTRSQENAFRIPVRKGA